jgi:exopolysaccharide production protein ExoY
MYLAHESLGRAHHRVGQSGEGRSLTDRAIRCTDLMIGLAALLFFGVVMLIVALAIKIFDPGPVLYRQKRIGKGGVQFHCLKFRTMMVDSDQRLADLLRTDAAARREWARSQKLVNDPRITPLGRFLRKSSLDELPQLFNVLGGEMSVVGPRPIVLDEVHRYGRYFTDYVRVRPGLTGLWQVNGRNSTTYRRRVALDVVYTRRRTLILNLHIVAMTLPAVVMARGCS